MLKYAAFALLVAMIGISEASMQNVTVKGIAICDKHRLPNIVVELWEKDTMDPNDKLAEVHTNKEGEFFITGGDNEVTGIEPYMKFRHSCKVSTKPGQKCTRKTEYTIPKDYIWNAETDAKDRKVYDMTYVTLDIFVSGEKEHCEKL